MLRRHEIQIVAVGAKDTEAQLRDVAKAEDDLGEAAGRAGGKLGGLSGSLGKLRDGLAQAGLALDGVRKVAQLAGDAFDFVREGAKSVDADRAFARMGNTAADVDRTLVALHGTVSRDFARDQILMARSLGLSAEQFTELAQVAKAASSTLGIDIHRALELVTQGTTRMAREMLTQLGLSVDTDRAQREYAAALGKTTGELTLAERQQAVFNAVVDAGSKTIAAAPVDALADDYAAVAARIADAKSELQAFLAVELVGPAFEFVKMVLAGEEGAFWRQLFGGGPIRFEGLSALEQLSQNLDEVLAKQKALPPTDADFLTRMARPPGFEEDIARQREALQREERDIRAARQAEQERLGRESRAAWQARAAEAAEAAAAAKRAAGTRPTRPTRGGRGRARGAPAAAPSAPAGDASDEMARARAELAALKEEQSGAAARRSERARRAEIAQYFELAYGAREYAEAAQQLIEPADIMAGEKSLLAAMLDDDERAMARWREAMQETSIVGASSAQFLNSAFQGLSQGMGQAIAQSIAANEDFGATLKKAIAESLMALSIQAYSQAVYFAALAAAGPLLALLGMPVAMAGGAAIAASGLLFAAGTGAALAARELGYGSGAKQGAPPAAKRAPKERKERPTQRDFVGPRRRGGEGRVDPIVVVVDVDGTRIAQAMVRASDRAPRGSRTVATRRAG